MADILVVAAHPDDEVLGCGGAILRAVSAGKSVSCLVLADGVSSRYEDPSSSEALAERTARLAAYEAAGNELGLASRHMSALPDNAFDSQPLLSIIREVEAVLEKETPTLVYTHFGNDLNIDHRRTYEAVMTACRPLPKCSVQEIRCFEIPSSTEWRGAGVLATPFAPQLFVDISTVLEKKLSAMKCYASESPAFPHPRSIEALEARAKYWGSVSGNKAAEPFIIARKVER